MEFLGTSPIFFVNDWKFNISSQACQAERNRSVSRRMIHCAKKAV